MINNNKFLPWIVVFSAAAFFFYEFLHMNLLNSIAEPLKTDFALTDVSIAFLSDLHLLGTIIFLLPSGLIIDHFQPRRVLLITLSAAIIATFIFSNTTS